MNQLTTTTFVQSNENLNKKVKSALKTSFFCRNAPFDERNIIYWWIFLKLKIEGEIISHNPQIDRLVYV